MTQNVVTYTVDVNTDNSDGKLLPYLTANLLRGAEQRDVLMVPNAALRCPRTEQVARPTASSPHGSVAAMQRPHQGRRKEAKPRPTGASSGCPRMIRPAPGVKVGLSDGTRPSSGQDLRTACRW